MPKMELVKGKLYRGNWSFGRSYTCVLKNRNNSDFQIINHLPYGSIVMVLGWRLYRRAPIWVLVIYNSFVGWILLDNFSELEELRENQA